MGSWGNGRETVNTTHGAAGNLRVGLRRKFRTVEWAGWAKCKQSRHGGDTAASADRNFSDGSRFAVASDQPETCARATAECN